MLEDEMTVKCDLDLSNTLLGKMFSGSQIPVEQDFVGNKKEAAEAKFCKSH